MKNIFKNSFLLSSILLAFSLNAESVRDTAQSKMIELEKLIETAQKKDINTLKERTALRTAEIFMGYADWDENNVEENVDNFKAVTRYKKNAQQMAELLADFEREEIVKMMDSSMSDLKSVMQGKTHRLPTPEVDWKKTKIVDDSIVYEGKPVFLADWTWKEHIPEYTQYHGNQDGFFLTASYVENENADISKRILTSLKRKDNGSMGFIFFNHTNLPKWIKNKYPEVTDGIGEKYTMYDINHPAIRKLMSSLISGTVPYMAGKQYTKLGYMLCNEPHWNTIEKEWAANPISDIAYEDFKKWLQNKHKSIKNLNKIWGTNYKSFDKMDSPKIMQKNLQGTPMYFDFLAYNMDRVTDWFKFLKGEIRKHDPEAMTHIKVMPNLWTEYKRDSGLDMEALTFDSDIIGNDVSSCGKWMWGESKHWEEHYSFDWIELCMGQDFFKSVSPEKIMYNTEGHMLSTGKYRDLYQTTDYARLNYWQAHIHGLTAMQTWYWARRTDGSSRYSEGNKGYAGSNNHQPRIVNEVHATIADLNSVSDIIMDFQRQKKSIRVFYTKASSINRSDYMDSIFATYESMFFDGMPIGFATAGIINNQDNKNWDMIVVADTNFAFEDDVIALQKYLDNGGTVIIDSKSLKTDEYGRNLKTKLSPSKGKLITVSSTKNATNKALEIAQNLPNAPAITITESNGQNQKTCTYRAITCSDGSVILNIANYGKNDAKIEINFKNGKKITSITEILTGTKLKSNKFDLPVYGLKFLKIK